MRLIDADKIRYRDMSDGRVVNGVWYTFMEDIDEMPTVKAIPIEWIMWEWRRNQPDDTQEEAWMRLGVLKMLEDWEKENENR